MTDTQPFMDEARKIGQSWFGVGHHDAAYLASQIEAALSSAYQRGWKQGYMVGFSNSGEGWNGEYPFKDGDINPESDPDWVKLRNASYLAAIRTERDKG